MKNFHIIEVKYLGATNSLGSRVRLYSEHFKESVTIPYDYALNSIVDMAEQYLKKRGHLVVGCGESKNGYSIICKADHQSLFTPLRRDGKRS